MSVMLPTSICAAVGVCVWGGGVWMCECVRVIECMIKKATVYEMCEAGVI